LGRPAKDVKTLADQKRAGAVYGWFTEGFDTRDLKGAKALLELELHQEVKLTSGEKVKKLRLVARTLVDNAIDGDTTAARECFDRMDGKVTQGVDAVRGDITVTWVRPAY
jgi:hypothetical protein